ncbi:MAG: thioredoxin family protein [Tannerella sp.]|jgi:thioredoxin-related protein|nr:thioredoxin family protein [Tannerella sp.]
MRRILYFTCICFIVQIVSKNVYAQETAVYEGLTYYLNKKEAFDAAKVQNKQVFLFWGSNLCGICDRVKKNMSAESVRSILDEHYILWFCDALTYRSSSPEVSDYMTITLSTYPILSVIDTYDTKIGHGTVSGYQTEAFLVSMLNRYVANDYVEGASGSHDAYVYQNNLMVKSAVNEEIKVYAVTGSLVDGFQKTAYSITRDASSYPTGILIVAGSSGWVRKVLKN